jgi:signal transduction histidine kinase
MKLLTKTSLHYLWVSVSILAVTGLLLFFILKHAVSAEIEEQLELQTDLVFAEIQKGNKVQFPLINIESGPILNPAEKPRFRDTLIYDNRQHVTEGYYLLSTVKPVNNKYYRITVMTIYIGWDEYSRTILYIFLVMALMLVCAGVAVNYLISRRVWQPFLQNMAILKQYSLTDKSKPQLVRSHIDEFEELNHNMLSFVDKAQKEYQGLQEFTDNASHELQTPISIIRTRLESMQQMPPGELMMRYLADAGQALDRVNKVNKGLLLLSKLSNDTFPDRQQLSLSAITRSHVEQLEELFTSRGLQLQADIKPCTVMASPYLVDILVSNLLSNMLMHATPGGYLSITLDNSTLTVINEGQPLPFVEADLFTRFKKGRPATAGVGLGLSIVKQICRAHQWHINYSYQQGKHLFAIQLT